MSSSEGKTCRTSCGKRCHLGGELWFIRVKVIHIRARTPRGRHCDIAITVRVSLGQGEGEGEGEDKGEGEGQNEGEGEGYGQVQVQD